LNLPTDQNLYIRARGWFRSGRYNASESITESVRNAFVRPLRIIDIMRDGNDVRIVYEATASNTYRLERKLALTDPHGKPSWTWAIKR